MKILFFTKGSAGAGSSRQRGFAVAEELRCRGYDARVYEPPMLFSSGKAFWRKVVSGIKYVYALLSASPDDILFLQRTIYGSTYTILSSYLSWFRGCVIFDFDDALYLLPEYADQMSRMTQRADAVSVGSHELKRWADEYNDSCYIIPTSVSISQYEAHSVSYTENNELHIGWVGNGPNHYDNLKLLVPVFKQLTSSGISVRFTLIGTLGHGKVCGMFKDIEGLSFRPIDELDWSDPSAVPSHVSEFDIGVMPLVDSEWNRGKCAFKAIEYMACGVPTIVSGVGENTELINHEENGFVANTTEEWCNIIERLHHDVTLREKVGKGGQKTVRARYSFEAIMPDIISMIDDIRS